MPKDGFKSETIFWPEKHCQFGSFLRGTGRLFARSVRSKEVSQLDAKFGNNMFIFGPERAPPSHSYTIAQSQLALLNIGRCWLHPDGSQN